MNNFSADFYRKSDGSCPVKEFLDSLDLKMREKMLFSVRLLVQKGNKLRMPYSEYLEDGIFELRAKQGSNITRVLYFFVVGEKAILTHGFIKKTQKTPKSEIKKAKSIRNDYFTQEVKK